MDRQKEKEEYLKGVFCFSIVQGLEYETLTTSGLTNEKGEFQYKADEYISFSVGGLGLGSTLGSERVTPGDLVFHVGKDPKKVKNQKVTNICRFLQSINRGNDTEDRIIITDEVRGIVKKYRSKIINFDQPEAAFSVDPTVKALFRELNTPLRSPSQARNQLRRTLYGIKKMTDVKILTRDGSYLLADIFRPIGDDKYPAIVALGAYGKVFAGFGCICNEKDELVREELEDRYFEGNQDDIPWENHETANTIDWVPQGYTVVRIDERGIGKTPGTFEQFSLQEAHDLYDAIEWVARQPWCNGNVGTWGLSYWAMVAINMAQLQPPSLKAMIVGCCDIDSYRDYIYNGGLYNSFNQAIKNSCTYRAFPFNGGMYNDSFHCPLENSSEESWDGKDWTQMAKENPFYESSLYGTEGKICISSEPSKIQTPIWILMPLEHPAIHIRGSSEAYIHAASKNKKLSIVSGDMSGWPYSKKATEEFKKYFDFWLKEVDNRSIMEEAPVKMMMRTGWSGYYWKEEREWPIERTRYNKYYLNAAPSNWIGDGRRNDFMKMSEKVPKDEQITTYSAEVDLGTNPGNPFAPRIGGDPPWSHGVSFITEPMPEDIEIAGYAKLCVWVSSTSSDMDIVVSVRVVDEDNLEVPYSLIQRTGHHWRYYEPVALGWLKVSHRKLDDEKTTVYRPYHTHLKKDHQPLTPGEIVKTEVEIWPTTARIKKGHRVRLDIQPTDGFDHQAIHHYDETYHKGALNSIYTGPDHPSYLQLPIIP